MKLKCEDCGWTGFQEECVRKYEGIYGTGGDVELQILCPHCGGYSLIEYSRAGEEVQTDT